MYSSLSDNIIPFNQLKNTCADFVNKGACSLVDKGEATLTFTYIGKGMARRVPIALRILRGAMHKMNIRYSISKNQVFSLLCI